MLRGLFMTAGLALWAGLATAECAGHQETFLSCTFKQSKSVDVCIDGDYISYAYGPPAQAEMVLKSQIRFVDYRPWPGVGSSIYESVAFHNGDVSYVVSGYLNREYPEDENADIIVTAHGQIEVYENDALLTTLDCDPGSTDFAWSTTLSDRRAAMGLCWTNTTHEWSSCE